MEIKPTVGCEKCELLKAMDEDEACGDCKEKHYRVACHGMAVEIAKHRNNLTIWDNPNPQHVEKVKREYGIGDSKKGDDIGANEWRCKCGANNSNDYGWCGECEARREEG